jgi:hypothetical protein
MEDVTPKKESNNNQIELSQYTKFLIESLKSIKKKPIPDELNRITVSQTVSFFGILYEKVRNAIEYREDHLIIRAAIERILRRRLMINPSGSDEGENLVRELLWARYFNTDQVDLNDVGKMQKIIDRFLEIRSKLIIGRTSDEKRKLDEFLFDLLTCEIEETLNPVKTKKYAYQGYFIFQTLRQKINFEGTTEEKRDLFFLVAIEKVYRRSDRAYQRYHLFITLYKPLIQFSSEELEKALSKMPQIFENIDRILKDPYTENLSRFLKKQLPPLLILFSLFNEQFDRLGQILENKKKLWEEVELICRQKYQGIHSRLINLAIRSFIYIFITKMIFALILEFPLSKYFYDEINWTSILINTIFPPILMLVILMFFQLPGGKNTQKIYQRIIDIIDKDPSFETKPIIIKKYQKPKKPLLIFGFTIFYTLTFVVTLSLIYEILSALNFNLISQIIFVFFVSLVTFFSYRIKQFVNEYKLEDKEGILTPIFDFFFMPILSLGKWLSQEVARLNFFTFIFDFIIEAPFKLLFEVVEEWIAFVRKRKEEII